MAGTLLPLLTQRRCGPKKHVRVEAGDGSRKRSRRVLASGSERVRRRLVTRVHQGLSLNRRKRVIGQKSRAHQSLARFDGNM